MLSGATLMDGALLLIAANEECPQPQTREHLQALQIIGIDKIIIVQSKIDLVDKAQRKKNYKQILEFIKGTPYEKSPIIPISAQQRVNIDALIMTIEENFPTVERDPNKDPIMFVARSFDINRPGTDPLKIAGGVLGGSLKQGVLKKGDEIELVPGRRLEKSGRVHWEPIISNIAAIKTGGKEVDEVHPGGSIGIMTFLDPALVKADSLSGSIAGHPGKLPKVWEKLKLELHLLERVVGAKDSLVVDPIKPNEILMLNVNTAATVGVVREIRKNHIGCDLKIAVAAELGSRFTISRRLGVRWRLIGYGILLE